MGKRVPISRRRFLGRSLLASGAVGIPAGGSGDAGAVGGADIGSGRPALALGGLDRMFGLGGGLGRHLGGVLSGTVTIGEITASGQISGMTGDSPQDSLPAEMVSEAPLVIAAIVERIQKTGDGHVVAVIEPAWAAFRDALMKDPAALHILTADQWEEMLAAYYVKAGFDEVILTARSGDYGRDLIATKRGILTTRIVGQMKAKKAESRVTADSVSGFLHVLNSVNPNATHGVFATTGQFAPKVTTDPRIAPYLGGRLQLLDGPALRTALLDIWGDSTGEA